MNLYNIWVSLSEMSDKNIDLFHDIKFFWDVPVHYINISLYVTICCYIHSITTSMQNIHKQKSNSLSNVS